MRLPKPPVQRLRSGLRCAAACGCVGWVRVQLDLILLDIGLPTINGIEAARQIRQQLPNARILFCSENLSPDVAEEALRAGAGGYLVKSDAGSDLLSALTSVIAGKRFVSRALAGHAFAEPSDSALFLTKDT